MNLDFEITKCCSEANKDMCEQSVLLTPKTVENSFVTVDISKPYSLGGGITIGNYVEGGTRKILVAPEGHTLLIGSTGSGKTESFYLPQIEIMGRSKDHLSFVVMDMKGNMFRQKSEMLKKNGFKVVVLNGKNPFASSKYNPLSVIFRAYRRAKDAEKQFLDKTAQKFEFMGKVFDDYLEYRFEVEQFINKNMAYCYQMIDQISEIVIPIEGKDPSWDYGAREIFKSMIYLLLEDSDSKVNPLTEEQFTFYNIAKSLNCRGSDYATLISYVNRHNEDNPGRKLLNYIDSQARQTRDSFMMGACDKLNRIVNLPLNTMSAYSDIDIDELVKSLDTQRTAIFLIADSANKSIYTLCNMFLIQLIVALQRVGDENPKGDFHILADEFCNMVPMPDIIDWITTMRSRRTWFHLGIQSYSQLEHHYSAEERYTIEGNSKTIFMGSNDFKTLESFSQAAGLTMKVANTYSVDNNGNMSLSLSSANAPLVRISDLANMTLGEAYVKMFGSFGNKLIKTVLDPDFKIAEFAHGNAEPEVVKGHSVSAEENAYDIRQSNKRNKLADSDEDEDLYNPFSKDPFDRMFMPPRPINTMDERKVQSKIKGIISKLSEKEKAFLIDMVKDRDFDAANKYVAESKEIAIYGQRFRMFGIIAYSILCRLALTRTEYNMLKKKLLELADEDKSSVQTASGKESADNKGADSDKSKLPSPYQIVFESKNKVEWPIRVEYPKKETQVDYSRKDTQKSIIRQTLIMGQIEANMKDTLSLKNMNLEDGVAELFLPFGTEKIKIVINNDSGKISDSGETFKSSTSKDTIGNAAYEKSIDNLISSFGLTKRTKGKSILLEKQFGSEKTLLQDVLAMYNVICMIRQISVLAAAFPDGNN